MSELKERLLRRAEELRDFWASASGTSFHLGVADHCVEAANRIEQLEAEVRRLREALMSKIRSDAYCDDAVCAQPDNGNCICRQEFDEALARATLSERES